MTCLKFIFGWSLCGLCEDFSDSSPEVWRLAVVAGGDPGVKVTHQVYNRMSLLLKSLVTVAGVTPPTSCPGDRVLIVMSSATA